MPPVLPAVARPSSWAVFTAPRGVLPYYLAVEFVAVLLVVLRPGPEPGSADWWHLGALLLVGIAQAELTRNTEKTRRYFAGGPHVNLTSVWIFAGALVLPPLLASTLAATIYAHLWLRVWHPLKNRPAYRAVFSGATMVLSCLAVTPVLHALGGYPAFRSDWHGLLVVVTAGMAFTVVNTVLVAIGVKLHDRRRGAVSLLGTWRDNALELATLCLGVMAAMLLAGGPALLLLMLLPVVVLRQLKELATQDTKTGLLSDIEWTSRAATELAGAERHRDEFAVLFIDLDYFKRVNDTHGHLAGDVVLRAVGGRIRAAVGADDSVGRWGGEEYAVLLPQLPVAGALAVAERIRDSIARLEVPVVVDGRDVVVNGLSASIGVATYPAAGSAVELLIAAADRAMYVAKENGRNRVVSTSA